MHWYILRRLLLMLPTLLGVAVIVFLLMRVIPGDIVEMRFAEGRFFNRELVEKERARFGLDRPLWVQFMDWMWGLVRLDFGLSMWSGAPIRQDNAMLPVITVIGLEFAFLIGGLVVTEQVFNLNGLGLLFVQSVARRDYTLVQTLVLLVAFVYIVVNFC